MKPVDAVSAGSPSEAPDSDEARALVVATLNQNPDATFDQVYAHLRSREGRALLSDETERLREAYAAELAHPTGAHRIGAVEAAAIAAHQPFRLRKTELVGLLAGLVPLVVHLPTTASSTVGRGSGETIRGAVYDPIAIGCGFIAIGLALAAGRQATQSPFRRPQHIALVVLILLIGLYQTLLGMGLLNKIGIFSNS